MRRTPTWVAWAVLCLLAPTAARAEGDTLYGALVMGVNAEHPAEAPVEIRAQAENLRSVFGYNQFTVVGENRKMVVNGTEDWLVSSPRFFLRVDTKNPLPGGGYALAVQLYREKRPLAEARVKLKRDNPLFIRGPMTARGQLIVLLTIL